MEIKCQHFSLEQPVDPSTRWDSIGYLAPISLERREMMHKSIVSESPGRKVHKNLVKKKSSAQWPQIKRSSADRRRVNGSVALPQRLKAMATSLQTTWDIPSVSCLPVVNNSGRISRFEWISSDLGPLSKLLLSPHFLPSLQCLEEAIAQERSLCQKLRSAVTAGHISMMEAIYAMHPKTENFNLSLVPVIYSIPRPFVSLENLGWRDIVCYYRLLMDSILESCRAVPATKCDSLLRKMGVRPSGQLEVVYVKIYSNIIDCFNGDRERMLLTSQECEIAPENMFDRMRSLCHHVLSCLGLDPREFWGPEQLNPEEITICPDVPAVCEGSNSNDSFDSPAYSPVSSREISWSPTTPRSPPSNADLGLSP